MDAIDRARKDEEDGDLGAARRRLMARVSSVGYSPEAVESIARLSIRMGDLTEGGRWYYLCDSADAAAADAIGRFERACGNKPEHIVSQLPLLGHSRALANLPDVVRRRLVDSKRGRQVLGIHDTAVPDRHRQGSWLGVLAPMGCAVVVIAVIVLAAIGVGAIVAGRWP